MAYTIWGYDIGQSTKAIRFGGDEHGHLWFADGFPKEVPQVETPYGVPAREFMPRLQAALREAKLWDEAAYTAYSICGPVVGNVCLMLINRGIREPFVVDGDAAVNDGMAATLGTLVAGVAQRHTGGLACFTLGTGVGFGSFHWDDHGHRVANDGETHFTVRQSVGSCHCHRAGCFEAAANEAALRQYLREEGFDSPDQSDLGWEVESLLSSRDTSPRRSAAERALDRWYRVLAEGSANIFVVLNLGGSTFRQPALFVFAGGLSALVDAKKVQQYLLDEFRGEPFIGKNFLVRRESVIGNRAGAVGAAALALAHDLGRDIAEIIFLDTPPSAA